MKRALCIAMAAVLTTVGPLSTSAARSRVEPPKPGYECSVGLSFDDETWGNATLDLAGTIQRADWTWRTKSYDVPFRLLILGGHGPYESNRVLGSGTAFLSWNLQPNAKQSPKKLLVQLTSSPRRQYVWGAFGTGEAEKSRTPNLAIYWPDLLAFVKSAPALNFNLLDDRRRWIDGQVLDRQVFLQADSESEAMLKELNAKIASYQTSCTKVDDIISRDIVV